MSRHKERRFEGFELSPLMESDAGKWVRIWPLTVFLLVGGLALVIRLFQLTVVEGNWRRQLAENNRIFVLPIAANRGRTDGPARRGADAQCAGLPAANSGNQSGCVIV
jgi:hypothetical protein